MLTERFTLNLGPPGPLVVRWKYILCWIHSNLGTTRTTKVKMQSQSMAHSNLGSNRSTSGGNASSEQGVYFVLYSLKTWDHQDHKG